MPKPSKRSALRTCNARIHPLEEALGFKSLLELGEPTYTIATIASRAGKSEAYVYGRIRLADFIPAVAEAFLKDQITIGHALLIAKLLASQQQEAVSAAFRGFRTARCFRSPDETNQYHLTRQSPHENDWLLENENLHGRASGKKSGSRLIFFRPDVGHSPYTLRRSLSGLSRFFSVGA